MRSALVYGANGALGRAVVAALKSGGSKGSWTAYGIDTAPCEGADKNFLVSRSLNMDLNAQVKMLLPAVHEELSASKSKQLDAIICVSGGFAMGSAQDPKLFDTVESMYGSSVFPSFIAAHLAAIHMKPGGLLVLPGAAVGGSTPTPWGLSYGSAKAAVHHIVRSLGSDPDGLGLNRKEGSNGVVQVVGFAPVTLDTPGNREGMPDADRSTWTPLPVLAEKLVEWAEDPALVESGEIYK
eukprot:553446-Rhodomonas_salina.1